MRIIFLLITASLVFGCASKAINNQPKESLDYQKYSIDEIYKIISSGKNVAWPPPNEAIPVEITGEAEIYKKEQVLILNEDKFANEGWDGFTRLGCLQLLIPDEILKRVEFGKKRRYTFYGEIFKVYGDFQDPLATSYKIRDVLVYPTCAKSNNIYMYVHSLKR